MSGSPKFGLSPDYGDFVSSADSLLSQFKEANPLDFMIYKIYPETPWSTTDAISMRQSIIDVLEPLMENYIWHKDSLQLKVILPSDGNMIYLGGALEFGDNIDDEWFVVYLFHELTTRFSTLSVSVTDMDGEFLLIESAAHIPDWLGPENCDNRVWIRKGKLHIIPQDEAPSTRSGGITLQNALKALKTGKNTVANSGVQKTIRTRIMGFPAKSAAHKHVAVCAVPKKVAQLLATNPQMVSAAVEGLGGERDKSYTRIMSSMSFFGATDTVLVPVTFTRALYAQLSFQQRFHPPPRFHSAQRKLQQKGWDSATAKSFDLGCRVSCGLELAYQRSRLKGSGDAAIAREDRRTKAKRELIHRKATFQSDTNISDFVVLSYPLTSRAVAEEGDPFLLDAFKKSRLLHEEISEIYEVAKELESPVSAGGAPDGIVEASPHESESDNWLHLTPEEFDRNMAERIAQLNGGEVPMEKNFDDGEAAADDRRAKAEETNSVPAEVESAPQVLSGMVEGIDKFMKSSSELGGVGDAQESDEEEDDDPSDDDDDEEEDGEEEEVVELPRDSALTASTELASSKSGQKSGSKIRGAMVSSASWRNAPRSVSSSVEGPPMMSGGSLDGEADSDDDENIGALWKKTDGDVIESKRKVRIVEAEDQGFENSAASAAEEVTPAMPPSENAHVKPFSMSPEIAVDLQSLCGPSFTPVLHIEDEGSKAVTDEIQFDFATVAALTGGATEKEIPSPLADEALSLNEGASKTEEPVEEQETTTASAPMSSTATASSFEPELHVDDEGGKAPTDAIEFHASTVQSFVERIDTDSSILQEVASELPDGAPKCTNTVSVVNEGPAVPAPSESVREIDVIEESDSKSAVLSETEGGDASLGNEAEGTENEQGKEESQESEEEDVVEYVDLISELARLDLLSPPTQEEQKDILEGVRTKIACRKLEGLQLCVENRGSEEEWTDAFSRDECILVNYLLLCLAPDAHIDLQDAASRCLAYGYLACSNIWVYYSHTTSSHLYAYNITHVAVNRIRGLAAAPRPSSVNLEDSFSDLRVSSTESFEPLSSPVKKRTMRGDVDPDTAMSIWLLVLFQLFRSPILILNKEFRRWRLKRNSSCVEGEITTDQFLESVTDLLYMTCDMGADAFAECVKALAAINWQIPLRYSLESTEISDLCARLYYIENVPGFQLHQGLMNMINDIGYPQHDTPETLPCLRLSYNLIMVPEFDGFFYTNDVEILSHIIVREINNISAAVAEAPQEEGLDEKNVFDGLNGPIHSVKGKAPSSLEVTRQMYIRLGSALMARSKWADATTAISESEILMDMIDRSNERPKTVEYHKKSPTPFPQNSKEKSPPVPAEDSDDDTKASDIWGIHKGKSSPATHSKQVEGGRKLGGGKSSSNPKPVPAFKPVLHTDDSAKAFTDKIEFDAATVNSFTGGKVRKKEIKLHSASITAQDGDDSDDDTAVSDFWRRPEKESVMGGASRSDERDDDDRDGSEMDGSFKEYMDAMDAELSGTTMHETFERQGDKKKTRGEEYYDVDVEKNLLTNLLESHAGQMGGAGPASTLLSQMGVELPKPPHLSEES